MKTIGLSTNVRYEIDMCMRYGVQYTAMIHYVHACRWQVQWRPPEMWPSTIMQTLSLVWNAISMDLYTNTFTPPEMWTPRCSVQKWMLGLVPMVSLSIQTHPYSGGTSDSLAQLYRLTC